MDAAHSTVLAHVPLCIHLISHFTSFPSAVICTTTGLRVLPSLLLKATSGWVGDGFPFDIKYHLPHTPGWREGVSIVAEFLYRTSRYTSPHPNFPPAATESGMELAPTKSLPFDPRSFWRAGDHLGRFDVTASIQARQITPKLQGYLAC